MDLVLWRARGHTQNQRIWIPSIEWTQALTHDTDTYSHKETTRLQRAPAEKDHQQTRSTKKNGSRPLHPTATPPSAPAAPTAPTTTPPPHLQTASRPRRRSGVQSSSAGILT